MFLWLSVFVQRTNYRWGCCRYVASNTFRGGFGVLLNVAVFLHLWASTPLGFRNSLYFGSGVEPWNTPMACCSSYYCMGVHAKQKSRKMSDMAGNWTSAYRLALSQVNHSTATQTRVANAKLQRGQTVAVRRKFDNASFNGLECFPRPCKSGSSSFLN